MLSVGVSGREVEGKRREDDRLIGICGNYGSGGVGVSFHHKYNLNADNRHTDAQFNECMRI